MPSGQPTPDLIGQLAPPNTAKRLVRAQAPGKHQFPDTPSSLGVGGVRPRQLLFGRQEVKFSSMTSGAVSQCQLLQSCPGRCPCQAGSGCRKATPKLRGWGSKVAMGGGHGDSGTARSFPGQLQGHPHTLAAVSPKHKPTFLGPTLPPLPSCSNRQGHWLEKSRPQPCPPGFAGGGAPACPLPSLPPFLLLRLVIHFTTPTYGQGSRLLRKGCSPVLEGDQQPGIQDVLFWFPRVISCK